MEQTSSHRGPQHLAYLPPTISDDVPDGWAIPLLLELRNVGLLGSAQFQALTAERLAVA